ncbi:uncharacterized protein METZ01_LOCUS102339 [marine metagenome]|uniref:Uncharacterized protein n=1 Tax=marine metagenome TaxID=408172 RepID=A0A381WAH8_9ZZZZ
METNTNNRTQVFNGFQLLPQRGLAHFPSISIQYPPNGVHAYDDLVLTYKNRHT